MKIAFIIPTLGGGGAERAVARIASGLSDKYRYDTYILVYKRVENEYLISNNVKLIDCNCTHKNKIIRVKILRGLVKKYRFDVVIPFSPTQAEDSFLATRFSNSKFLNTVRNNPWRYPAKKKNRILRDWLVDHADGCIFQTEEQKLYFNSSRVLNKIIYNPIESEYLLTERTYKKAEHFMTAGRLSEQKNQKMLVNVWGKLENQNVYLEIYGEGPLDEYLKNLIIEKGLENRIKLMGRSNNMKDVLMKADAFILSSDYEGMPNALIEAMACGLPCISTDCKTGPKELIRSYENGLLVPTGDVEKMKEAIEYFIENPKETEKFGLNARKSITMKCSIDYILKQWNEMICSLTE